MIRLTRVRTTTAVHDNFRGDQKKEFEKELMIDHRRVMRGELKEHDFNNNRWKKAKAQLLAETHGKCAYCEAPTSMVAYGDVEHYRPKSVYWWLAYAYENYLASCTICNSKFKGAKFPISGSKIRGPTIRKNTTDDYIESKAGEIAPDPLDPAKIADFDALHQQERPLLLNPYHDDPEEYFAWQADDALQEVELVPRPGNPMAEAVCKAALKHYGLNRPELKHLRYFIFKLYRQFRRTLGAPQLSPETKEEIRQTIEGMKAVDAPFAGMICYFDSLPLEQIP